MKARRIGFAVWLMAAAGLYFFENNTGTRAVLACSILLPALSAGCAALASKRAGLALEAPVRLRKGEEGALVCRVDGAALPGCAFDCRIALSNALTGEAAEKKLYFTGRRAALSLSGAGCGSLSARIGQAWAQDLFGLCRFSCGGGAACAATVTPLAEETPFDMEEDGALSALRDAAFGQRDGEPDNSRLRDYQPGDPVRQIHWKLSAKVDRLLLRENAFSEDGGLMLMLETARAGASPAHMDAAVEGLLGLSRSLAEGGASHSVCWYDCGPGVLRRIEVESAGDYERVRDELLQSASAPRGESVARVVREQYPEDRPRRAIIFSPHAFTDVSPFLPDSRVTLALPEDAPFSEAAPGVQIVRLPVDSTGGGEP